ncbi:L,D-transpeptidase family protein [Flavobacterium algicola]|uniref:L,D-transpeptidase family protein n=1 Tax=Flavobacterium algicola TaxID=556529 RepID=UPI001EFCC1C7|nr:L,D-transpeptidase family protein [Flavobacterium algicola]MCG9791676.1 L,D-transpeptidase family protein [Flavobacterium algicola]
MRKLSLFVFLVLNLTLFLTASCNKFKDKSGATAIEAIAEKTDPVFDSINVTTFFQKHPLLDKYQDEVRALYRKHNYKYIWYDKNGVNEFGSLLHNKIINIEDEGVLTSIPYRQKLDSIYESALPKEPNFTTELLNTSMYFFYVDKVYQGLDTEKTNKMEWFLPRDKQSYGQYLDSLLVNPALIKKNEKGLFAQYYLLQKTLKKYRKIEKDGGWGTIEFDPSVKSLNIGDSSNTIAQLRNRLYLTGELENNSKSAVYDETLGDAVLKFKKTNRNASSTIILPSHLKTLNISVTDRIKTLVVNMERCRWIPKDIIKAKEIIAVNIPAYELTYFKDGKPAFKSNVVVGKTLNKTVIFSAPMRYIVFSPYWNIPYSIIKNEIKPGIAKNPNYLAQHNMEWNDGRVRQKPGSRNSLGLVKFLFPNSNSIYLHDTPSKHLFSRRDRAFSHGCIRVEKPKELAEVLLQNEPKWTSEKIDEAMHGGKEVWHTLQNKIPVYIGYFTAWVDTDGTLHFYEDVYKRDQPLADLLFEKEAQI